MLSQCIILVICLLIIMYCDVMTKLDHTHLLHLQLQEYLLVYEFHCLLASVCDLDIFLLASVSVCDLVIFPVFHICTLC